VLTLRVLFPAGRYARESLEAFSHRLVDHLRAVPGIRDAAYSWYLPLVQSRAGRRMSVVPPTPGAPPTEDESPTSRLSTNMWVHHAFFRTLGFDLIQGRGLSVDDDERHPRVVVVNEASSRSAPPAAHPASRR